MRKCFVISPLGEEGSETRKHADDVFDYIIAPALKDFDIELIRSDKITKTGEITNQIYTAIQEADLILSVLTYRNPNVFFELAIALCAGKAVITLMEKGKTLPFDMKGKRTIFYDLGVRAYQNRIHIDAIRNMVRDLEKNDYAVPNYIPGFSPMNQSLAKYDYFDKSMEYGTNEDWGHILDGTNNLFYVMGISLNAWQYLEKLSERVLEKARQGCKVKFLLMHKDNPALPNLINEETNRIKVERYIYGIEQNFKYYSELANQHENIEVRLILNGIINHTQYINDAFGIYIPYFYSKMTDYTPLWRCDRSSYMYEVLLNEFNILWELNK